MRKTLIAGVALLALAGCNKSAEPAKTESEALKREPGAWKTDMKLVKLDMPGAPAELKDAMTAMMGQLKGVETCLTPEQAAQEDIAKSLANAPGEKGECSFTKKDIAGGKMDVAMVCTDPATKQQMNMTMTGNVAPKEATVHLTVSGKQGELPLTMELEAKNVWTGPCKS